MNWQTNAACAGQPGHWWFSENSTRLTERALRICETCDVRVDCHTHAIETGERYGIWGGATADERLRTTRREQRKRRLAATGGN